MKEAARHLIYFKEDTVMKGYTFYSKSAGIEVEATTAKKEAEGAVSKEGRVTMRFFTLGNNTQSLRFVMKPEESFGIGLKLIALVEKGVTNIITHKFTNGETKEETITKLSLEKFDKSSQGNKSASSGHALVLNRGEVSVNVSMALETILFMAELLQNLAIAQAWSSFKQSEGEDLEEDDAEKTEADKDQTVTEEPAKEEPKGETPVETGSLKVLRGIEIHKLTKTGLAVVKVGDDEAFETRHTKRGEGIEIKIGAKVDVLLSDDGRYINEIEIAA